MGKYKADQQKIKDEIEALEGMLQAHEENTSSSKKRGMLKKGVNYFFVQIPIKNFGIFSLSQTHHLIKSSIKSITAPRCPKCFSGKLNVGKSPVPELGADIWFCSQTNCEFCIYTNSGKKEVQLELQEIARENGLLILNNLTENEKENLIQDHLLKAKIYRNFSCFLLLVIIFESVYSMIYGTILTSLLTATLGLIALKWGYRAWQVKTGNLFLLESGFFKWLKTAEAYFSVNWVERKNG